MLAYLEEATLADNDHKSFAFSSLEARHIANLLTMAECELVITPDQLELDKPAEIAAANDDWKAENDQLGRFIVDCCVVADSFSGRARPLYERYRAWAEGAGESAISETLFGKRLKDRGFSKEHQRHGTVYVGIAMRLNDGGSGEKV